MTILEQFRQRQQTQELFLWAHLALLALLPLALVLTMAGLAVGDPLFPSWLEMPVLAAPSIVYVVWQQWHRPIYPFSLGFVHRSVTELSLFQRQILTIVKRPATGWIAVVVGVFLYSLFRQIYFVAPLADVIAPFPSELRFLGIVWSLVFFFLANVIAQVGIVALRILVLPESELQAQPAYEVDKIKQDFTVLGAAQRDLWKFDQPMTEVATSETKAETTEVTTSPPEQKTETTPIGSSGETITEPEEAILPEIPDLVFTTETKEEQEQ